MSGKPRCSEIAEGQARRDPDGMVKAGLLEPQRPFCKGLGLGTAIVTQGFPDDLGSRGSEMNMLQGSRPACSGGKGANEAPKPSCLSTMHGTRDSLTGASLKGTETPE